MKLQAAVDLLTVGQAVKLLNNIYQYVDIIEVGTPLVTNEGLKSVAIIKSAYPECTVLCDLKISDGGEYMADLAFAAGADIVTVMACADDVTISGAVRSARRHNGKVCADTICMSDELIASRIKEVEQLGVDIIAVHTAHEALGHRDPIEVLRNAKKALGEDYKCEISICGGINTEKMERMKDEVPDIIVVGSAIHQSDNPAEVVKALKASSF